MTATDRPAGLQLTRKIDFEHLFETLAFSDIRWRSNFEPFGPQVLFELYRWMISSARVKKARYRGAEVVEVYPGIMQVIAGSNRMNDGAADALGADWRVVLRARLMHALRDGGEVARWREDQKIDRAKPRSVPLLHYKDPPRLEEGAKAWGEEGVAEALDALFALGDGRYFVRPSKTNKRTREQRASAVQLHIAEVGWRVVLEYSNHESSSTHPGEVQRFDEPFFDFIIRARKGLEKILSAPCAFRRPPRVRAVACSAGWSGSDPKKGEIIGGIEVKAKIAKLDLARDGFSPILFADGEAPKAVTFGRRSYETATDPERYRISRRAPLNCYEVTEEQVKWGRARYLLTKRVYELAFLDLPKDTQFRAEDQFLEDGLGSAGSALRKYRGAGAFVKTHPRVAWHDAFNMRCHGKRCDDVPRGDE